MLKQEANQKNVRFVDEFIDTDVSSIDSVEVWSIPQITG